MYICIHIYTYKYICIIYVYPFIGASAGSLNVEGEYHKNHYGDVYQALESRGLALPIELPGITNMHILHGCIIDRY
jgi:hypothetical protein